MFLFPFCAKCMSTVGCGLHNTPLLLSVQQTMSVFNMLQQYAFYAVTHFFLTADIPLLPSISSLSCNDDEEPGGLFTVHWLNNKELNFTLAMEVFLQQLQGSLDQQNECSQEGTDSYLEHALKFYLCIFK